MIWSVVSKAEMEGSGSSPVFRFYCEVLGKDNVKLAVVDEDDPLDFVEDDDIVLLRTASKSLVHTIRKKGVKSTAEDYAAYELVYDKSTLSKVLGSNGILVPKQYRLEDVIDGHTYFVKPRYGSDSQCISKDSICHTKEEILKQISLIKSKLNQDSVIEDYIDGAESTCASAMVGQFWHSCSMDIECEEGIQTSECKSVFKGFCTAIHGELSGRMSTISLKVFKALGLKHHVRIDFRRDKEGNLYVIDINLLAGLSPIGLYARCYSLCMNSSYWDVINLILGTATR